MDLGSAVLRNLRWNAIGLFAIAASSCTATSTDKALRTVQIYDLLDAVPNATAHVHQPSYMSVGDYEVGDESRRALFLHPTGNVEFPLVHLSSNAVLGFWIGIDKKGWDKAGDGVEFTVFVSRANDARTKVYSRYIDPKHNPEDRRWIDGRVSLKPFRNEDVRIILATSPGPSDDFNFDWALWAEPRVILDEASESRTP